MQRGFAAVIVWQVDHRCADGLGKKNQATGFAVAERILLFSCALRLRAVFLWMMPRLAALSIAEMYKPILFGSGCAAEVELFCIPRSRVITLRFRRVRAAIWRARLAADFVLAMV